MERFGADGSQPASGGVKSDRNEAVYTAGAVRELCEASARFPGKQEGM